MNSPMPTLGSGIPPGYVRVESQVEGITVYAPAPHVEQIPDAQTFKCPNCGATTAFDPRAASVTCSNCGSMYALNARRVGRDANEFEFTLDTLHSAPRGWGVTRRDLHCEKCGATTSVSPTHQHAQRTSSRERVDASPTELSTTCPFCGSNRVGARTAVPDAFRPRFLVPFKIERDACASLARAWLKRDWMYPRDLVNVARGAQFVGIYLSFWTFRARVQGNWRAEVGHEITENYFDVSQAKFKTRTRLEWKWQQGNVVLAFDDELETGTSHIRAQLLKRLAPFDLNALVTYDPGYLAGWRAQSYEIALDDAWDVARAQMREKTRAAAYADIDSKHARNFSVNAVFDDEAWRLVLLPVYLATYRFRDKTYQLVINGQTGKVAGDKPIDWKKVLLIVAAFIVPGILLAALAFGLGAVGYETGGIFLFGGILFCVGAVAAVWVLQQAMDAGKA